MFNGLRHSPLDWNAIAPKTEGGEAQANLTFTMTHVLQGIRVTIRRVVQQILIAMGMQAMGILMGQGHCDLWWLLCISPYLAAPDCPNVWL